MSFENLVIKTAKSFHLMDLKDVQTNELLQWIDFELAHPTEQEGLTVDEKVLMLKEARINTEKLFLVVEEARQKLKSTLNDHGAETVAAVGFAMKDFIKHF